MWQEEDPQEVPEELRRLLIRSCQHFWQVVPGKDYVYVHRIHTSALEYDCITRQGVENKMFKLGSEAVQRRAECYIAHGQHWLRQLAGVVGDEAWAALSLEQHLQLGELRGEFEFFRMQDDALAPLGLGCGRDEPARWNVPRLSSGPLSERLLNVHAHCGTF